MKKIVLLMVIVTLGLLSYGNQTNAEAPYNDGINSKLLKFAQTQGVDTFKEIVSQDPTGYGYDDINQVNKIQLGHGFRVHFIDSDKLNKANNKNSISSIIKKTNEWDFFIELDGNPISFITISRENSTFEVVSVGGYSKNADVALNKALEKNKITDIKLIRDKGIRFFAPLHDDVVISEVPQSYSSERLEKAKKIKSEDFINVLKEIQNNSSIKDGGSLSSLYTDNATEYSSGTKYFYMVIISLLIAFCTVYIFNNIKKSSLRRDY